MARQKPNRRQLRFDEWHDVLADVNLLREHGYDRAGNLSLGQICDHLAVILEFAMDGFPGGLPRPVQKLLRLAILGRMLKHKPTRLRVKAPAFAAPAAVVDDDAGIARMKVAIERFTAPDVQYKDHFVFGPLSPYEWKHQQLWHCEHHLSYLHPRNSTKTDSQ